MSKFKEWQSVKEIVNSTRSWLGNREKIDSQDGLHYRKVKMQALSLEYCGQSYAGANNYHKSPKGFDKYIALAFDERRVEIENRAFEILENESKAKAILAEGEVKLMLKECTLE